MVKDWNDALVAGVDFRAFACQQLARAQQEQAKAKSHGANGATHKVCAVPNVSQWMEREIPEQDLLCGDFISRGAWLRGQLVSVRPCLAWPSHSRLRRRSRSCTGRLV